MVEEIFCELCLEVSQLFYEHQKCSNYRKMKKKIDHAKRPVCTRTLTYPQVSVTGSGIVHLHKNVQLELISMCSKYKRNGYSFNRDNFQNSFIPFLKRSLL